MYGKGVEEVTVTKVSEEHSGSIFKVFKVFKGRLVGPFQHCSQRLIVLLPQMSSFIHLQRRHAPYRHERPLLAKEGTITKGFS